MTYEDFLKSKVKNHVQSGFNYNEDPEYLFPFQNWVVKTALKAGKYAVFSGTGTGKSRMQLKWSEQVVRQTQMPVLLLAPLGVGEQTRMQGIELGIDIEFVDINNYEQLDNINTELYGGIAIDEGSIIKNHEGVYRNKIIEGFRNTPYKSVWTATPAPNDPMEIGNYSEFLNVMSRAEMLAMYFVHDGGETSKWRLKKHAEVKFWEWVSSWAVMFQHPKDIGFDQEGYDLPELKIQEIRIETEKRDNGKLFNDTAVSATDFNGELRASQKERMFEAARIANQNDEQYLIWIKHNEEGRVLRSMIPDSIEVSGSDSNEVKVQRLLDFAAGKIRVLITKEKIAAMGWNFQSCGNQIFASIGFSFEQIYQAIRRSLRFGRVGTVNAWFISTDTMSNTIDTYYAKEKMFLNMQQQMTKLINSNKHHKMEREFKREQNEYFDIQLGDCVQLIKNVPDESIGLSVFSPPFSELYVYSDQIEDMGNSKDYKEFLIAFKFLIAELYRVLWSGRNVAVHCMDLPIQKGKEGYIGLRDFSGIILQAFSEVGFIYHSRVTIWKDPVVEMQRTKALGLLHKQVKKDSAMSRVGIPDYLMVFRKPGEINNDHPVKNTISVDTWQKWASPVWMDINYTKTLNGTQARDEQDEKHIAPLQLETIERAIGLWSNAGDTILTPFMGVGSEVYQAVKMNRKGIGFELKESYFEQAVKNCKSVVLEKSQLSLV